MSVCRTILPPWRQWRKGLEDGRTGGLVGDKRGGRCGQGTWPSSEWQKARRLQAQTQPRQHRGGQKTWKRSRHSSGPSGTSHSRVCGGRGIQCLDFALGGREAATEATQTLSANARRRSGKHPSERNPYVSQASACQGQAVDSPGCFFAAAAATEAEAAVAAAPAAPAPAATPLFPKAPPPFFGSRVRGARAVHPRTARAISCPPADLRASDWALARPGFLVSPSSLSSLLAPRLGRCRWAAPVLRPSIWGHDKAATSRPKTSRSGSIVSRAHGHGQRACQGPNARHAAVCGL